MLSLTCPKSITEKLQDIKQNMILRNIVRIVKVELIVAPYSYEHGAKTALGAALLPAGTNAA